MNYRERMYKCLKEPNDYSGQYGKWGALNIEQRKLIRRLLNEMDNADIVIREYFEEKENLIKYLEYRYNDLKNMESHTQVSIGRRDEVKDILERIKSGNYE